MNDYYQILEVEPNASQDEIKKQYRFLVQAWHPDKFGSAEAKAKAKAEEKLKQINAAYTALKNSTKEAQEAREKVDAEADRIRREKEAATQREYEAKVKREAKEKAERDSKQTADNQAARVKADKEAKLFCTNCGTSLPPGQVYCPKCEQPFMPASCPHCGKKIPQGSLFCPGCGKKAYTWQ